MGGSQELPGRCPVGAVNVFARHVALERDRPGEPVVDTCLAQVEREHIAFTLETDGVAVAAAVAAVTEAVGDRGAGVGVWTHVGGLEADVVDA